VTPVYRSVRSFILILFVPAALRAQDNYEIQVYGSETVPPLTTMIELHSNFTFRGSTTPADGVLPTDHALHETLEITQGLTSWSEIGFYCFTNGRRGDGFRWVGSHIRPRVRALQVWGWPLGASLSLEAGYQRRLFAQETWSLEIRPIVDRQFGPLYVCLNPALDGSLSGRGGSAGLEFSPAFKLSYDIDSVVTVGVEYYGSLGDIARFAPPSAQHHMIFPSLDLNVSPEWEFNFGVGFGVTESTDRLIVKLILGRRLGL
jgi:hypothetical protein